MIGKTISHYRILNKIGAGGMGVVFKAHDSKLNRIVALKFLPPQMRIDETEKKRFLYEAQAASTLDHSNICTIHSIEETEDGHIFIVMAYYEGLSLKEKIEQAPLPLKDVVYYSIQIASGLQKAHEKGIVHRDLKPANIFITNDDQIKIIDFGLARVAERTLLTKSGTTLGTVPYMSPEQAQGTKVDHRTDIWSLGVVIFEMITGQRPFKSEYETALVYSIINENPEPVTGLRSGVPVMLENVILKCLEKDPSDRYQSANEVLVDIRRLEKRSGQEPESDLRESQSRSRIRKIDRVSFPVRKAGAIITTLIVAVAVIWFAFLSLSRDTSILTPERIMLVVLPFQNLGGSEMDYLVDGITDEITSTLTTISGLGVIGRASAVRYKNTTKTVREIADELGVTYIMDGTVRWERKPDGEVIVRVNPQLIRVSDATQVWAQSFDAVLSGVLALQSEIAAQVANALDVGLRVAEMRTLEMERKVNPEAYDYYLRGLEYYFRSLTESEFRISINLFRRAVELDPTLSSAYAKMSKAYSGLYWWHFERTEETLRQAENNARRAIELAPDLADGYEALGWYYYHGLLDYDRALTEFNRGLAIQPQNSEILQGIAGVKRRQGKIEESIRIYEKLASLNPTDPIVLLVAGETYRLVRDYETALHYLDRSIRLAPDFVDAYNFKAFSLVQTDGNVESARKVFQEMKEKGIYRLAETAYRNILIYLPMYERNYNEILELLDANPGYISNTQWEYIPGDLFRALIYYYSGDPQKAPQYFESAHTLLNSMIENDPQDARLYISAGIALAGLGRFDEALRSGERAVEILPLSREAYRGAYILEGLARIYAMTGEYQRAIDALETLLSIPSHINHVLLRLDPAWDLIRDTPGFRSLLREFEEGIT